MSDKANGLNLYIDRVVEDLACALDPDEKRRPSGESLRFLKDDLRIVIEGRVADWEHEKRQMLKGKS
jgi:hypothetical protein